ncbi:MAG TPA: hypothetical protein VI233_02335 [Puia sp.]
MLVATLFINTTFAQEKTVEVGGAAMYPSKNIIQNAVNSKDHKTLVASVKAAGLVETLQGPAPSPSPAAWIQRRSLRRSGKAMARRSSPLSPAASCG